MLLLDLPFRIETLNPYCFIIQFWCSYIPIKFQSILIFPSSCFTNKPLSFLPDSVVSQCFYLPTNLSGNSVIIVLFPTVTRLLFLEEDCLVDSTQILSSKDNENCKIFCQSKSFCLPLLQTVAMNLFKCSQNWTLPLISDEIKAGVQGCKYLLLCVNWSNQLGRIKLVKSNWSNQIGQIKLVNPIKSYWNTEFHPTNECFYKCGRKYRKLKGLKV